LGFEDFTGLELLEDLTVLAVLRGAELLFGEADGLLFLEPFFFAMNGYASTPQTSTRMPRKSSHDGTSQNDFLKECLLKGISVENIRGANVWFILNHINKGYPVLYTHC